jgi:hypothetical protein
MAIVPLAENRVQEQGLPNVRVSGDVPLSALGGGQSAGQVTQSQLALNDSMMKEIEHQKQKADQIAVMDYESQITKLSTDIMDAPGGALSQRGLNAMSQPEQIVSGFEKTASELTNGLTTSVQRQMANQKMKDASGDMYRRVMHHAAVEGEKHADSVFDSWVKNLSNAAIMDGRPSRVQEFVSSIYQKVDEFGERKGLTENEKIDVSSSIVSKIYSGVVTDRLNKDQFSSAKQYYDEKLPFILPVDRKSLEGAVKEGDIRRQVSAEADKLFEKYPEEYQTRDAVKEIKDLVVRERVAAELSHKYDERARDVKAISAGGYDDMVNTVKMTPQNISPDKSIDLSKWVYATPEQKELIVARLNVPKKPNDAAWFELKQIPTETLATMGNEEFDGYWTKLNLSQRNAATARRKNAIDAVNNPASSRKSAADQSFDEIIMKTAQKSGIVPSELSSKQIREGGYTPALGDFERDVQRHIKYFEDSNGGRIASSTDIQKIAETMAIQKASGKKTFEDVIPLSEIPRADVSRVRKFLESKNMIPSDANVEIFYGLQNAK